MMHDCEKCGEFWGDRTKLYRGVFALLCTKCTNEWEEHATETPLHRRVVALSLKLDLMNGTGAVDALEDLVQEKLDIEAEAHAMAKEWLAKKCTCRSTEGDQP